MFFKKKFLRFAQWTAQWAGSAYAFMLALGTVIIWGLTGPIYKYSDTWQLVINTGTTIITFIMVFLIQNTQNRDGKALQLKLDELIRATEGAHSVLMDLEKLSDEELEAISHRYYKIAEVARIRLRQGLSDTDIPDVVMDEQLILNDKDERKSTLK